MSRHEIRCTLDCASVAVELASNDVDLVEFVAEFFDPWFAPTAASPEWHVIAGASESAVAEMARHGTGRTTELPCFAHDQRVMSLPAQRRGEGFDVYDAERSCLLRLRPGAVELVGDPRTRRWRFTLLWIFQEIAATRQRRTHVDAHAAAVEFEGRALVIAGPKNAGKTTLSFYLMQAGWGSIANDRCFLGVEADGLLVRGMPTAVKIRPGTLERFPVLAGCVPAVARPYLYSRDELRRATGSEESIEAVGFLALTPTQIADALGAPVRGAGVPGALVFPEVTPSEERWSVHPLAASEVEAAIHANLYGTTTGERPITFFEQAGGGHRDASPARIGAIAAGVRGYRLCLGPDAYAGADLSDELRRLVAGG